LLRRLAGGEKIFARQTTFFRTEVRPLIHPLLQGFLLLRTHCGIAGGDVEPFFLAVVIELAPIGSQGGKNVLLRCAEVLPARRRFSRMRRSDAEQQGHEQAQQQGGLKQGGLKQEGALHQAWRTGAQSHQRSSLR
jgi:hypothetical protein